MWRNSTLTIAKWSVSHCPLPYNSLSQGMAYLESVHFVHRALKAHNVLVVNENFAKISGFGLSHAIGPDSDCYEVI